MVYQNASYYNIRKSAFKNVRTAILNFNVDIGTNIYGAYPLKNLSLPLCVIENGLKQPSEESNTLSDISGSRITVIIHVYAKEAEKVDTYIDDLDATLRGATATFATYGMILRKDGIEDNENITFTDVSNNRVHSKSLSVTFEVDGTDLS